MIALAVSLAALGAIGAATARAFGVPDESRATRSTRGALAAFATLFAVQTGLGIVGWLTAGATLAALVAVAAAVVWRARGIAPRRAPRAPWSAVEAALAAALAAAFGLRLWAGLHKTAYLYDALSYHLHTPVTWMHDRGLEIVPAAFGDLAPAYAPANLELWFLFLMAPLRSDLLAGSGQLPLAALAALAIAAAVRETGGTRAAALAAALAFLLVPEVWQQAPTAMVDLGMAAFLLASLPFLHRSTSEPSDGFRTSRDGLGPAELALPRREPHRPGRADLLAFAAALGLAAGTKFVGAVLALPFAAAGALAVARRRPRPSDLGAAFVVLTATGGFFYARNLAVAGNPLFPVATLGLPGLYDGRAMRGWDYHVAIGDLAALGEMLRAAGIGFASAATVALARAWRRPELPLAIALVALFWLAVPYQESRFLFAAFGVAAVAMGRAAGGVPPAIGWGALAAAIGGALVEWPTPERLALVPAAAAGALAHLGARRLAPRARRLAGGLLAGGAVVALAVVLAAGAGRDPGYTIGNELDAAWIWFRANVRGARVAYTGTNLAFPLAGAGLANEVRYANVAGSADAWLHDLPRPLPRSPSAEPAPYRDGARFDDWLANLRAARAQVLFVAALYPIVARSVAADGDGFPVERTWADAHPALFHLRYASSAARVYEVAPEAP